MTYTVGFSGSRHYNPGWKIQHQVLHYVRTYGDDLFIKVGDCPTGLDKEVISACDSYMDEDQYEVFEAEWAKYGNSAGPRRNHEMVDSGMDILIAYPEDDSRGTKDCAEYAASKGIEVIFPDLPAWSQWAAKIATFREY